MPDDVPADGDRLKSELQRKMLGLAQPSLLHRTSTTAQYMPTRPKFCPVRIVRLDMDFASFSTAWEASAAS